MTPPLNYAEALRALEDAEQALTEAQVALIESARARGATEAMLEYLWATFWMTSDRLLH